MKELEELTREIREKLPRLKELSEGCKLSLIWDQLYIVVQSNEDMLNIVRTDTFSNPRTIYKNEVKKIIGKDPMLNDVLDWLSFVEERELLLDYYGNIGEIICDRGGYYLNPLAKWDLSKPYLKDQSPELIKFLHGLINH